MKKIFFGVVASIIPVNMADLRNALVRVPNATSLEVRLDKLGMWTQEALTELSDFCRSVGKPVILTLRAYGQGGEMIITTEGHWDFWERLPKSLKSIICDEQSQVFVDWGLDLLAYCKFHRKPQIFPWSKVGASWHDFTTTPQDLQYVLDSLMESPARAFLKLVSKAPNEGAVARIRALFHNRTDPRPLIAFAMGAYGTKSRCDCMGWGSAGTYGYVYGGLQTASGQLSVDELLADPSVRRALQSQAC